MSLDGVDVVILIVTGISCMFGLWRGFVREVLSLLAWIAALLVARLYSENLGPLLGSWIASEGMQTVFAFAVLFIATLVAGALVNHLVGKLIDISGLKLTDRLLGGVFGIARGVVILMVFIYFGTSFFATERWWTESRLIPYGVRLLELTRVYVMDAGQVTEENRLPL
ncbi:MAG: CvpA family protein [Pseudomonadales bacterium]|nr:CvpA family protein [Pseudomonadales bacterium]MCP5357425.1 CvpA family protein [Pseudomonadales bacterium]